MVWLRDIIWYYIQYYNTIHMDKYIQFRWLMYYYFTTGTIRCLFHEKHILKFLLLYSHYYNSQGIFRLISTTWVRAKVLFFAITTDRWFLILHFLLVWLFAHPIVIKNEHFGCTYSHFPIKNMVSNPIPIILSTQMDKPMESNTPVRWNSGLPRRDMASSSLRMVQFKK